MNGSGRYSGGCLDLQPDCAQGPEQNGEERKSHPHWRSVETKRVVHRVE
jgi:hypothetical protein